MQNCVLKLTIGQLAEYSRLLCKSIDKMCKKAAVISAHLMSTHEGLVITIQKPCSRNINYPKVNKRNTLVQSNHQSLRSIIGSLLLVTQLLFFIICATATVFKLTGVRVNVGYVRYNKSNEHMPCVVLTHSGTCSWLLTWVSTHINR